MKLEVPGSIPTFSLKCVSLYPVDIQTLISAVKYAWLILDLSFLQSQTHMPHPVCCVIMVKSVFSILNLSLAPTVSKMLKNLLQYFEFIF